MVLDADGAIVQDKDLGEDEIIELRLKPQKTTFNFPNDDIRKIQENTEESIKEEVDNDKVDQIKPHQDKTNERKRKASVPKESSGYKIKEKPASVSTVDVDYLLQNLKRKNMMNMSGLESLSILLWFIEKMMWLTELVDGGKINETEITELLFGETLWKSIIDNELDIENDEIDKFIIDELKDRKEKLNNRRKLEMISKSQEELGVSLRKSSLILNNFEDNDITDIDLEDYIHENIGNYEKCCTNNENLQFIHKKFYLKVEPKIGLVNYIDRINTNLDISAAVGLCTGWFLFKYLFNLRCNEYLSDGFKFNENDMKLSLRSLPLSLGASFNNNESSSNVDEFNEEILNSQVMNPEDSSTSIISNNEESLLDCKKVTSGEVNKRNAFRLILSSVRIASKLIEDKNFKQGYYCKVTGLQKVEDLFRLELALGYGLDWELFTNEYTLWRYLLHMKCLRNAVKIIEGRINIT